MLRHAERLVKIYYFNAVGVMRTPLRHSLVLLNPLGTLCAAYTGMTYAVYNLYTPRHCTVHAYGVYRNRDYGHPSTHNATMFATSIFF